jgi:glycosyltransferase involved in cell wall biosynthesis
LMQDFGLTGRVIFSTNNLSDDDMAWALSACDVALSVGSGEGFGYAGSEALACGIPVVHGRYAGSVAFIPDHMLVDPVAWRYEGFFGCKRPVFNAADWATKVQQLRGKPAELPPEFRWSVCWERWAKWLKEGL